MKNYIQKGISLTLVASMVVCGFSGCGTTKTTDNTDKTLGTAKETNNEANVEALLTGKLRWEVQRTLIKMKQYMLK